MKVINPIIKREAQKELARRNLFFYCKLKAPDFYKESRDYLVKFCTELQNFMTSKDDVLVINAPPRHGKSRTAQLLVEWALGNNQNLKIMTGSYNETVATQFSKGVRNSIQEISADDEKLVYSDIFPGVQIKEGDGAANLWSLKDGYNNYLATSPTGTATGFGADLLIIDDVIKNSKEANNSNILSQHWEWFNNTMLSRLESGGKIIIIMTRWHTKDLAGRILDEFPDMGYNLRQIKLKAVQDDGSMLCPEILSKKEYLRKVKSMSEEIAKANYQQEPINLKGVLYSHFKLYDNVPVDLYGRAKFDTIKAYIDTADTGEDYLCSIVYGVYNREAYILDVIYTKDSMETTEISVAKQLKEFDVNVADIEGNNGGRGFARSVERITQELGNFKTVILTFHQSNNKQSRILSNATWIMTHIYFPSNWRDRWPEYYSLSLIHI